MYRQFIPVTQVRDKNNGSVFLPSEANRFDLIADGESVEHIIARIRNEKREEKRKEVESQQIESINDRSIRLDIETYIGMLSSGKHLSPESLTKFIKNYKLNTDKLNEFGTKTLLDFPKYWENPWPYVPKLALVSPELEDMSSISHLTREKIMTIGNISGKRGKDGLTFIVSVNERTYAVKTFDMTKPSALIQQEAFLQEIAASVLTTDGRQITPSIFAVNTSEKYIIMGRLQKTIVDYSKTKMKTKTTRDGKIQYQMSDRHQEQIIANCHALDKVGVLHNDGNALNIMLDEHNNIQFIDFGFSKLFNARLLEKRGPQPNTDITLWGFIRGLKKYNIIANLLKKEFIMYSKEFMTKS